MPHDANLIATLALGLSAALVGGVVAQRLRLPPIVGYLLAGMAIGPSTPGLVADTKVATELADIGVILLMFGVGIHFSIEDLLAVRRIAVPGALVQIATTTGLGLAIANWWGWSFGAALVFGLALSVASTVVLLRTLTQREDLESEAGHTAVGWLVVEDLVTVFVLVLLPALADALGGHAPGSESGNLALDLGTTVAKTVGFVVLMLVVGIRVIPPALDWIKRSMPRELFIVATLATALGIAYAAAELFDVSVALGAFLAGIVVNQSSVSHAAAEEALPLREAFAVLFFVSVGMLVSPSYLVHNAPRVAVVAAVVILGKAAVGAGVARALGATRHVASTVAAGLAQIGEFSFILAEMGRSLGLLSDEGRSLILAGALVSISLNPLAFATVDAYERRRARKQDG
ncbi:MAG TPA: cation:proton antiporter [Acidimicrobiia bacterium]